MVRLHGNWCGPNWTAGQHKPASDLTEEDRNVPAVDALDTACKHHDINLYDEDPEANNKFYEEVKPLGLSGAVAATFVKAGGPPSHSYLRGEDYITPNRPNPRQPNVSPKMTRQDKIKQWRKQQSTKKQKTSKDEIQRKSQNLRDVQRQEDIDVQTRLAEMQAQEYDPYAIENMEEIQHNVLMGTTDHPMRQEDELSSIEYDIGIRPGDDMSLVNMQSTTEEENTESRALTSQASNPVVNGRETAVNYNVRPEMGIFTETRTAYLPLTMYFSFNRCNRISPVVLKLRLNHPYDILKDNTLVVQNCISNGSLRRNKGLSNDMAQINFRDVNEGYLTAKDESMNYVQLYPFPHTVIGATAADNTGTTRHNSYGTIPHSNCRPGYLKWYTALYKMMHTMACDYRITFLNGADNNACTNAVVYEIDESYTAASGTTGLVPTNVAAGRIAHWPRLKKHKILSKHRHDSIGGPYTIQGTWTPKTNTREVVNEESIKTWYPTAAADTAETSPLWVEQKTLLAYSDEFESHYSSFLNVRVDLRYKVQFKDLIPSVRYPYNTETQLNTIWQNQDGLDPELISHIANPL